MLVSEISLWGAIIVACFVFVAIIVLAGMLLGGVSALVGLAVVLLLIAAAFVANVLAGIIALMMLRTK